MRTACIIIAGYSVGPREDTQDMSRVYRCLYEQTLPSIFFHDQGVSDLLISVADSGVLIIAGCAAFSIRD